MGSRWWPSWIPEVLVWSWCASKAVMVVLCLRYMAKVRNCPRQPIQGFHFHDHKSNNSYRKVISRERNGMALSYTTLASSLLRRRTRLAYFQEASTGTLDDAMYSICWWPELHPRAGTAKTVSSRSHLLREPVVHAQVTPWCVALHRPALGLS